MVEFWIEVQLESQRKPYVVNMLRSLKHDQKSYLVYRQFQSEVISVVPILVGNPSLYTNNLDVARQVIGGEHKSSFIKPTYASQALLCVVSRHD